MSRWPRYGRDVKTCFGGLTRSELMTRIRSGGNKSTELKLAMLLRQHRLNGWRRHADMTEKPDFVWHAHRTAVFADGCFWHGHDCNRNLSPKRNIASWRLKIAQTKRRDRRVTAELKREGWLSDDVARQTLRHQLAPKGLLLPQRELEQKLGRKSLTSTPAQSTTQSRTSPALRRRRPRSSLRRSSTTTDPSRSPSTRRPQSAPRC
jgi:DNA mismatch endonuclease, patch repair protein